MDNLGLNTMKDWSGILARCQRDMQDAARILTRLPISPSDDAPPNASCYWAFPLIGIAVAGLASLPMLILYFTDLPPLVLSAILLAGAALLTGGLHEDGLADIADSLGGENPKHRREIMRDSHIGSFGVIALVLVLGIQLGCLAGLAAAGLTTLIGAWLSAASLGRAMMGVQAWRHATPDNLGLAHSLGRPSQNTMLAGVGIGVAAAVLLSGTLVVLIAAVVALALTWGLGVFLKAHIGGVNGDGLGATQMLSQTAILMVMAVA